MYSDESRSPEDIRHIKIEAAMRDPEKLYTNYQGLVARDLRYRKQLAEYEVLKSEVKQLNKRLEEAESLKNLAEDRLSKAEGSLRAYRAETKRLKDDLKRLRASRALRLSRAISSYTLAMRKLVNATANQDASSQSNSQSINTSSQVGQAKVSSKPAANSVKNNSSKKVQAIKSRVHSVPVSQRSIETLLDDYATSKTPQNFMFVVNRLWFTLGSVQQVQAFIKDNPAIVKALSPKDRVLVDRILGFAKLPHLLDGLPPRAEGCAYQPESNRVMYCAHSTPAYNSNGYSTRTLGVVKGLKSAGLDVSVVARAGYPWDSATDTPKPSMRRTVRALDDINFIHLPGENLTAVPADRYILQAADAYVREARLQRPSLIQSASNHLTALPALIAARRLGVPFVYEVRGLWEVTEASEKPGWEQSERYKLAVQLETFVANEADGVLAITQQVADELVCRGVPKNKISLAPNAVDTRRFVPLPADENYAKKYNISLDLPTIGFVGSTVPYEGLSTLLDASAILSEQGVKHQVVIAGSGKSYQDLQQQQQERQLKNIMFVGRIPMDEVPRLISCIDIMPCPRLSLPVTELVSPLKPLEAFSSAKAVILSDVAPHKDLAGLEERALLFEAGNASELAKAIRRLIEDSELASNLGRAARLWTVDHRTWANIGSQIVEAHRQAVTFHKAHLAADMRELKDLKVGVIADEFTSSTLAASFKTSPIRRSSWKKQLLKHNYDLVFIESAWNGNSGEWHKGVGYYGAEENSDIIGVINTCRELGVPTVFWNKEDPIHYERFYKIAARCDHVFTTDGNMVPKYLSNQWSVNKTVSSLPFYAQPAIHNPLASQRPFDSTIAHAGTYYGDRYKLRSQQLRRMLEVAQPFGLAIYDRQLAYENSPYSFPDEFQSNVRGVLPYQEVIDSYKTHIAHINVNSVSDSPTMFSRRVVEIAACGGLVLSGPGRGIEETFGNTIPASNDAELWKALLYSWTTNPVARINEAWFQLRTVYRAHTVNTALTILVRTAGIAVKAPTLDSYSVVVADSSPEVLKAIASQSVKPEAIYLSRPSSVADALFKHSETKIIIGNFSSSEKIGTWISTVSGTLPRTHFEDLLYSTRYGSWKHITYRTATSSDSGMPLATPYSEDRNLSDGSLSRFKNAEEFTNLSSLELLLPPIEESTGTEPIGDFDSFGDVESLKNLTVLFAGHDLKFARDLISATEKEAKGILIDQWVDHSKHDEELSIRLLEQADVIFCEWGLGNAVWYSQRVKPHQRLVVRVHSQELRRPYLSRIKHSSVSKYIFVGELIRQAAVISHGVPADKTVIIPNTVDTEALSLPKTDGAEFNIGLVGIVARGKRLDRALDVLERLHQVDTRYKLFIKGKQPSDYPWMLNRPDEMAYYNAQYSRIDEINNRVPGAVVFDPHGNDMPQWYQKIGIALSVSDFESFHLTLPDGAASGARPMALDWPGADLIYPRDWIFSSTEEISQAILGQTPFTTGFEDELGKERVTRAIISTMFNENIG
ncbi:glycosyltransferase [Rothia nasimurium]|uniref:glycosyltransferase n=1 Tax=Rothia nasimurium TaxID=85336 RepID=UPI001F48E741|nr:glycosyltransferase [Rothia nasimurium]